MTGATSLPRKYSPDRKVKISPIGAPAVECRARATGNIVTGWKRRCARFPSRRAGDSRKMRGGKQGIRDLILLKFRFDLLPYARDVAARFGIVPKRPQRSKLHREWCWMASSSSNTTRAL